MRHDEGNNSFSGGIRCKMFLDLANSVPKIGLSEQGKEGAASN